MLYNRTSSSYAITLCGKMGIIILNFNIVSSITMYSLAAPRDYTMYKNYVHVDT